MTVPEASEKVFEDAVIQLARLGGWEVHKPVVHKFQRNWLKGWPDLTLVRFNDNGEPGETIFAECKTRVGKLTPEQSRMLKHLARSGFEVHVWRPADLQRIADRLKRR